LLGAPFIQSYFNLTDRLRVDLGARYDVLGTRSAPDAAATSSATHGVVSPKLGALVHVTPTIGVYGNVSRGFRSTDGIISDPTLAPITVWAYEGGTKFDRNGFAATAALFRMDVSNEQTFNPVTLTSSNGGASRRQGVELDWRLPSLANTATISGNWMFNDARYRGIVAEPSDDGEPPVVLNGLHVYNTSTYLGAAAIDLATRGAPWRIRVSGTWVGDYSPFDEPGVVLGGYGLGHISGAWTFRVLEADVGVRNVFDRAYPELVAGHIVAPGQPRTIYFSLRARP
jgi:outer membrane receptor protein involved in Fe transport